MKKKEKLRKNMGLVLAAFMFVNAFALPAGAQASETMSGRMQGAEEAPEEMQGEDTQASEEMQGEDTQASEAASGEMQGKDAQVVMVGTDSELANAVKTAGEYRLTADVSANRLMIEKNITLDGDGHKLTSANSAANLKEASIGHLNDGLASTFKNIIFDGGGQQKTDTCMWLGRGSWVWQDVTLCNWSSASKGNRGAVTLGKSKSSPGRLDIYGAEIKNNKRGLALDHAEAIANVYGINASDNETGDIYITAGTVNFLDDEGKMPKTAGLLVLDGGTANLSGNTYISTVKGNGGALNITGNITSEQGTMTIVPNGYRNGREIASISDGVDAAGILSKFVLPEDAPEGYTLALSGSKLILQGEEEKTAAHLKIDEIEPINLQVGGELSAARTIKVKSNSAQEPQIQAQSDNPAVQASMQGNILTVTGRQKAVANIAVTASVEAEGEIVTDREVVTVIVAEQASGTEAGSVLLYNASRGAAPVIMDSVYSGREYSERTYTQIRRAVQDLRQDFGMVTGAFSFEDIQQELSGVAEKREARLSKAEAQKNPRVPSVHTDAASVQDAVIIGAIEESPIIQQLIADGKLDEAKGIRGQKEGFVLKKVASPMAGVGQALVIAGADARGTIYGIYTLSEKIGVSPWYWWSDVPVDVIGAEGSLAYTDGVIAEGSPDVELRGIFINDEEKLREWAYHKKDPANGFGWPLQVAHPDVYNHVYELLLRLKANTLWPAMHEGTVAFNVPTGSNGEQYINAKNASEYGIIMSSSHCEMMLRNNVGEWKDWYNANKDLYQMKGSSSSAAYDYTLNKEAILAYWEECISSHQDYESIFPVGMRGVHDGAPVLKDMDGFIAREGLQPSGSSDWAKKIAIMKDIITEQRNLIEKYFGSKDGAPQVFIPYKEMSDYYNQNNGELSKWLADTAPDIMLMWAEDNFGYLRQVPNEMEQASGRKNGIYYHNSYWGSPKSWLWLNSLQLSLMDTEMRRAYNTGAGHYWILNVGDIKPGEILAEYFMDMAWDVTSTDDTKVQEYLTKKMKRDFNVSEETAEQIADCLDRYYRYIATKRPEHYGTKVEGTYLAFDCSANGDEGMLWVGQWNALVRELEGIYEKLDENAKDAFYEQILHAVKSNRDVAEEYVYLWKNELAVSQGRYGSAQLYKDLGLAAVQRIDDSQEYFWTLNGGKWDHVIEYEHIGRYRNENNPETWNKQYQGNQGPSIKSEKDYKIPEAGTGIGAACENNQSTGSGTLRFTSIAPDTKRFFDVFGKSSQSSRWTVDKPDWVILSQTGGTVYTEQRIRVMVDWAKVTSSQTGKIQVYNADAEGKAAGNAVASFTVNATVAEDQLKGNVKGYQEADGYVMIEAEHYSRNKAGSDGTQWLTVQSLAQRGDCIKAGSKDGKNDSQKGDNSPYTEDYRSSACVEYDIYFQTAGTFTGIAYRVPTLNSENGKNCRTLIGLNDTAPELIRGRATADGADWKRNVVQLIEPLSFTVKVERAGWNTLKLYRATPSMIFDRILIMTQPDAVAGVSGRTHVGIGPAMSPNNIVEEAQRLEYQKNRIGELPNAMTEIAVMDETGANEVKEIKAAIGAAEETVKAELDKLVLVGKSQGKSMRLSCLPGAWEIAGYDAGQGGIYTAALDLSKVTAPDCYAFGMDIPKVTVKIQVEASPEVKYTVTFEAAGGTVSPESVKVLAGEKIETQMPVLPTPVRKGYRFLGWYTAKSGGKEAAVSMEVNGDIILYAQWKSAEDTSASDQKKANAVIAKIKAIGKVTKNSGKAIKAAEDAYNKLNQAQKKLVMNYKVLQKAKKDYAALKKAPSKGSKHAVGSYWYKVTKSTEKSKTVQLLYPKNKKMKKASIPESVKLNGYTFKVTAVADKAFRNNKRLASVTIGKNVGKIGRQAFEGCSKLKTLTVKTVTLKKGSIGKYAIKGIYKKAAIKVPKKKCAFYKKLFSASTGYKKTMKVK